MGKTILVEVGKFVCACFSKQLIRTSLARACFGLVLLGDDIRIFHHGTDGFATRNRRPINLPGFKPAPWSRCRVLG